MLWRRVKLTPLGQGRKVRDISVVHPIRTRRAQSNVPSGPAAKSANGARPQAAPAFVPVSNGQTTGHETEIGGSAEITRAASTLGALIALQENPHPREEIVWAEHSLGLLEKLHQATLTDTIDDAALVHLKTLVEGGVAPTFGARPGFNAVRDALLLRVRVELAKRGIG
ncbi:MAG: flagellar assembly protein FliX [Pseudomonadota bacterium]